MATPIVVLPPGTNEEALGPPIPDDLTLLEWASRDVAEWHEAHAEIDEARARAEQMIAFLLFRELGRVSQQRRKRATLARRVRWTYEHVRDRLRQPGTEATVKLPTGATLRTQAAGGKPKIEIDDEKLAMEYIRRKRWAKLFIRWEAKLPKSELQKHLEKAKQIAGIRVVYAPDGFFIDGLKVDPITGERVGKK